MTRIFSTNVKSLKIEPMGLKPEDKIAEKDAKSVEELRTKKIKAGFIYVEVFEKPKSENKLILLVHRGLNGTSHYSALVLDKFSQFKKIDDSSFKFKVKLAVFNKSGEGSPLEKDRATISFANGAELDAFLSVMEKCTTGKV